MTTAYQVSNPQAPEAIVWVNVGKMEMASCPARSCVNNPHYFRSKGKFSEGLVVTMMRQIFDDVVRNIYRGKMCHYGGYGVQGAYGYDNHQHSDRCIQVKWSLSIM